MRATVTLNAPTLKKNPFLDRPATRGLNALTAVRAFKTLLTAVISGVGSKRINSANVRQTNSVEYGLLPAVALVTVAAPATSATVTINGTALTAAEHRANCTVTFASVANARTITVNGLVLTAKTSPSGAYEFARGGTDAADALAFVNCLNALTVAGSTAVTAAAVYGIIGADRPAADGVVNIYALAEGTAGNSYTIATSNGTELAITNDSSGSFAGGAAATNNQFDHIGSNAVIARAVVNSLAASSTAILNKHVAASCRKAIVTCATVLPSSATVTIDGTTLRGIKETTDSGGARVATFPDDVWGISTTDTLAAVGLVNCINAHPKLSERFHAVNAAGVVTIRERPPEATTPPPITTSDGTTLAVTATTNGCFADSTGVLIQSIRPGHGGNGVTLATSSGATLAITLDSSGRLAGGTSTTVSY